MRRWVLIRVNLNSNPTVNHADELPNLDETEFSVNLIDAAEACAKRMEPLSPVIETPEFCRVYESKEWFAPSNFLRWTHGLAPNKRYPVCRSPPKRSMRKRITLISSATETDRAVPHSRLLFSGPLIVSALTGPR